MTDPKRRLYFLLLACSVLAAPSIAGAAGCIIYIQGGSPKQIAPYGDIPAAENSKSADDSGNAGTRFRKYSCQGDGLAMKESSKDDSFIAMPGTSGCHEIEDSCWDTRSGKTDESFQSASQTLEKTIQFEKDDANSGDARLAQVSKTESDSGLLNEVWNVKHDEGEDSEHAKALNSLWDEMEGIKTSLSVANQSEAKKVSINNQIAKFRTPDWHNSGWVTGVDKSLNTSITGVSSLKNNSQTEGGGTLAAAEPSVSKNLDANVPPAPASQDGPARQAAAERSQLKNLGYTSQEARYIQEKKDAFWWSHPLSGAESRENYAKQQMDAVNRYTVNNCDNAFHVGGGCAKIHQTCQDPKNSGMTVCEQEDEILWQTVNGGH